MLLIGFLSPHLGMEHLLSAAARNLTIQTVSKRARHRLILNMRQQSAQPHRLILFMIIRYIVILYIDQLPDMFASVFLIHLDVVFSKT